LLDSILILVTDTSTGDAYNYDYPLLQSLP